MVSLIVYLKAESVYFRLKLLLLNTRIVIKSVQSYKKSPIYSVGKAKKWLAGHIFAKKINNRIVNDY